MGLLENSLLAGLTGAGLALAIRAGIDISGNRPLLYKKPWGCNLCMAFWSSVPASVVLFRQDALPVILPAYFTAYALLETFWAPPPPDLVELVDDTKDEPSSKPPPIPPLGR
jgi:hypothetical protein